MKKEITTIKLSKKTAELLNRFKIHPRQPYEEVILKFVEETKSKKESIIQMPQKAADTSHKKEITTIKLSKKTAEILNQLKIHPRQPYEEVILNLISQNESTEKKNQK